MWLMRLLVEDGADRWQPMVDWLSWLLRSQ